MSSKINFLVSSDNGQVDQALMNSRQMLCAGAKTLRLSVKQLLEVIFQVARSLLESTSMNMSALRTRISEIGLEGGPFYLKHSGPSGGKSNISGGARKPGRGRPLKRIRGPHHLHHFDPEQ